MQKKNYSPDIYIFNLVHNDFDESINGLANKPMYLTIKIVEDTLKEIYPVKPERKYQKMPFSNIMRRSSLMRYFFHNLEVKKFFSRINKAEKEVEMNIFIEDVLEKEESIQKVTNYIIQTINSEFRNKEVIFIMDAPRRHIYSGELEKAKSRKLNILAGQICSSLGIHFIDLSAYMVNDYMKNGKRFETDYDNHWNEYGHQFVATVLYEYLITQVDH
jgi:hypothetical protein